MKWALYSAPMLTTAAGKPDSTSRQVLVVLAEHADDQGKGAYPSPVRISHATGLDDRTVERAVRRLELGGLISRDGFGRNGCIRWKLTMSLARPASDLEDLEAAADSRRADAARRQARRRSRIAVDVSRTQSALQPTDQPASECDDGGCVTHSECVMSRTLSADVTHSAPPEPPVEPPGNHQSGGTLPPDPLRPQAPTTSGLGNEQRNSINKGETKPPQNRTTTSAARGNAAVSFTGPRGDDDNSSADHPAPPDQPARGNVRVGQPTTQPRRETEPQREGRTCPHGRNSRRKPNGQPRCPECREEPEQPPDNVIPFARPA